MLGRVNKTRTLGLVESFHARVTGLFLLNVLAVALVAAMPVPTALAMDLKEALATSYFSNPDLDAARARLRATDESVSQAHGAFRPELNASGETSRTRTDTSGTGVAIIGDGGVGTIGIGRLHTTARSFSVTAEQNLFRGLRDINRLRQAEASVAAGQAQLLRVEQVVLFSVVSAYADVLRDRRILALRTDE